jgi:hypothetical protein
MFRNLFAMLCVVAVIGAFIYAARPDWFSGLIASSKKPQETVTLKTTLLLPAGGKAPPSCGDGTDVRKIVDLEEEGLPLRSSAYIMVVSTSSKLIRYYRLTPAVQSVRVRTASRDVESKVSRVLNSNGPLQVEIWVDSERELTLDVDYTIPKT